VEQTANCIMYERKQFNTPNSERRNNPCHSWIIGDLYETPKPKRP